MSERFRADSNQQRQPGVPGLRQLHRLTHEALDPDDPNLVEAMRIHGVRWST